VELSRKMGRKKAKGPTGPGRLETLCPKKKNGAGEKRKLRVKGRQTGTPQPMVEVGEKERRTCVHLDKKTDSGFGTCAPHGGWRGRTKKGNKDTLCSKKVNTLCRQDEEKKKPEKNKTTKKFKKDKMSPTRNKGSEARRKKSLEVPTKLPRRKIGWHQGRKGHFESQQVHRIRERQKGALGRRKKRTRKQGVQGGERKGRCGAEHGVADL